MYNGSECGDLETITHSICDDIFNEMDRIMPKNNIVSMHSFLYNLSSYGIFRLIKENSSYIVVKSIQPLNYNFYGQNKCVIILPIEGIVLVTTLDIAMNMSGIQIWYTNPELIKKIRTYKLYNTMVYHDIITSPHFIVSSLPSDSLTLVYNNNTFILAELVSKHLVIP